MDREQRLGAVAARQLGVFTVAQAVGAGFPERTVRHRTGRVWRRVHRGVLGLPGYAPSLHQDIMAVWLACGEPAAVSGLAAASWWGLGVAAEMPELTVPHDRRVQVDGAGIRRTRRWGRLEVVRFGAVTVTSVPRTMLDLAPVLDEEALELALDAAHRSYPTVIVRLKSMLGSVRGVAGSGALRELVALRDPQRPIETRGETKLYRVLRWGRLPLPTPQYWITTRQGPRRIDFAYPVERVALEYDEYAWHSTPSTVDADNTKDAELAELGWTTRRLTERMVDERPHDVVWMVSRALGLRPSRWVPELDGREIRGGVGA